MSTNDPQPNQQDAVNDSPLRQKLLHEIACIPPPPSANSAPLEVAENEEVECGNVHPYRDLNLPPLARKVDALFLQSWLDGDDSNK